MVRVANTLVFDDKHSILLLRQILPWSKCLFSTFVQHGKRAFGTFFPWSSLPFHALNKMVPYFKWYVCLPVKIQSYFGEVGIGCKRCFMAHLSNSSFLKNNENQILLQDTQRWQYLWGVLWKVKDEIQNCQELMEKGSKDLLLLWFFYFQSPHRQHVDDCSISSISTTRQVRLLINPDRRGQKPIIKLVVAVSFAI